MTLNILHSDDDLLVVNKPTGLATIPEGWDRDAPHLRGLVEAEFGRVWVVHRLDKVTSGVILFARNPLAHRSLSVSFESRLVTKTYHALVCGIPLWDSHIARHPLRPGAGHPKRTVFDPRRGQQAATRFQVRERFGGHSVLEAFPETGRTHQVRAHAALLGFPILADTLYGAPETDIIPRPALHAVSLEFNLDDRPYHLKAPYPADFEAALKKIRAW